MYNMIFGPTDQVLHWGQTQVDITLGLFVRDSISILKFILLGSDDA